MFCFLSVKTRWFCSFPIYNWRIKFCKMQGRFQNRVLGCWWKTSHVPCSLPARWGWPVQPCGLSPWEGEIAPLLSPPLIALHHPWTTAVSYLGTALDCLFSAYKLFRDKRKTPPPLFLNEGYFLVESSFCKYVQIASKFIPLFHIQQYVPTVATFFFLFPGTTALSSTIAGLKKNTSL